MQGLSLPHGQVGRPVSTKEATTRVATTATMKLTKKRVQHIANLAKLNLSDEEIARFQKQLSSILEYVELLNEINTEGTEVTAQTTGLKNVYREDKSSPDEVLTQKEVLSNALEKQNEFIWTRAVL